MKILILAGGYGTRLSEETSVRPKPMIEIGGKPILWHIMNIYSWHGFDEFVIALGYRGDFVKEYFLNFFALNNDISIDLVAGTTEVHQGRQPQWKIDLVDTGIDTMTGGRLARCRKWLGNRTFMMTYGDGVADIDLGALLAFHREHGRLATVTAVRPPARFGGMVFDGNCVTEFTEKPQTGEGWINGGFFILEPEAIDYVGGDAAVWEREPMERLASEGQLMVFRHEGFWQPMDTLRDTVRLNELWQSGHAPWKVWP